MSHIDKIIDADPHFIIDIDTRNITNASAKKTSLVQYDHNSERFSFTLPRYVEGHDMTLCNSIRVHYINLDTKTQEEHKGIYEIDDIAICEDNPDNVCCTWIISQNATQSAGILQFILCFSCLSENGEIEYAWHTNIFTGISVSAGINNSEEIVEQYADILAQWSNSLFSLSEEGVTNINTAKAEALTEIESKQTTIIAEIEQATNEAGEAIDNKASETLASIPEDYSTIDANVKNMADGYMPLSLIEGSRLDTSGAIYDYTTYSRTDYVSCAGQEYIVLTVSGASNRNTSSWFYDADKNPLSSFTLYAVDCYIPVPEGAEYFIISANKTNVMPYLKIMSPDYLDLQYAKNGVYNLDRESRNFEIITGKSINTDGSFNPANFDKCITSYIPCKNENTLYIDINLTATTQAHKNHWFYDADKNPITDSKFALKVGYNEIPVPEGAEYVVLSAYMEEIDALKNAIIKTKIRADLDGIIGDLTVSMSDSWIANAETSYNAVLDKMKELSYDGIPFFIQTDKHGLSNDPAKWIDNTDKRIKNLNLGDINLGNFNVANAKAYCDSTKRLVNLISVYGNHDVAYDTASDEPVSYYALNEYYPTVNRRNKDKHSYFTVTDDLYNVKYIILCPYYLNADGTDREWKFEAEQVKWLIEELTKNDGYDIVTLMHEPIHIVDLIKRDGTLHTHTHSGQDYDVHTRVWEMLKKRKNKESGSITDSDGNEHQYDFTDCSSDYLCSLHGHTHRETYYTDGITQYTGDSYRYTDGDQSNQTLVCTFGVIDRADRKLFIYKFDKTAVYDVWELEI